MKHSLLIEKPKMALSKNNRNLGKLGESLLTTLTAEVGITANKAFEDETGWDFLLELPMEKSPETGTPLDLLPAPVSCLIQVKATDNFKKPIQVKLSNWLRMINSPQPYFFLILDFAGENICNKAFLVHCGFATIEKVLKKCRKISNSDEPALLNKLKQSIQIEEKDSLETVTGGALISKILQHIGSDFHEYSKNKLKFFRSAGYEKLKSSFQMQVNKPDQFDCAHDYIVDFAIGRIAELPFQNLKITEVRFGIPSKQPCIDAKEPGVMTIVKKAGKKNATVFLGSINGKNSLQLEMEIFIPTILPMNFPKLRLRLATAFIEILLPYKNDSTPEFKFHYPACSEKTSIRELASVARLVNFLKKLPQTKAISFQVEYDSYCLTSGKICFPGLFSESERRTAKVICAAAEIADFSKVSLDTETSINQIIEQENIMNLVHSAIQGYFGILRIEFSIKKEELEQGKSFLIPFVQEITIGNYRLIYSLAIFGQSKFDDISDEMARVTIFPCEGFVFKSSKFAVNKIPEFSIKDYKNEIFDRFKNSHVVVFLED